MASPTHPGRLFIVGLLLSFVLAFGQADEPQLPLGAPTTVAGGVDLFAIDRPDLSPDGTPQSVRLLRVDPAAARLKLVLARDRVVGTETVPAMAARHGAVAAVNAGFFARSGDPVGILRLDGQLVSDTGRARGAVAIDDVHGRSRLLFDQVTARVRVRFRVKGAWDAVPVDAVDAPATPNRLVLFSPRFDASTGTTAGTTEWTLSGPHLAPSPPSTTGDAAIPSDGFVVSYGGPVPPALASFSGADRVDIRETLTTVSGDRVRDWLGAPAIVGGAGLLVRNGRALTEWERERLSPAFATTRHPRTLIGQDRAGTIWLVTVDGRQPGRAEGMTFAELQVLCRRLALVDALNLDGGGSTTMVVDGAVVNRPSDLTGPRSVSDAILVFARR